MGAAPGAGDTLTLSVTGTREELLARQAAGCAYLVRKRVRALRLVGFGLGPAGIVLIVAGVVPVRIEPFTMTADPETLTVVGPSASSAWRWSIVSEVVELDDGLLLVLGENGGVLALPAASFPTPDAQARAQAQFASWISAASGGLA